MGVIVEDGLGFEEMYQREVDCFASAKTGVPGDDVEAAIVLRRAGQFELLRLLHQGVIHVIGTIDVDEDEAKDLEFAVGC